MDISHDYPPGEWTVDDLSDALSRHPNAYSVPRYDDQDCWERIRSSRTTAPVVERLLETADDAIEKPLPRYRASLYLEWERSGDREPFQAVEGEFVTRLGTFVVAECLRRDGTFLDAILDYAWALCERATWHTPPHLREGQALEGLPVATEPEDHELILSSTFIAQLLAEVDYVLGDELHPALRERIREDVDRRVFVPFEENSEMRWMSPPTNNHNAVCNANIGIAALYLLDDADRQAELLEKATRTLEFYLEGFGSDGCTAEGMSYWNYGFGPYVQLAAALEERTAGEFSLLSPPIIAEIAKFPYRVELSPGSYPAFSDASLDTRIAPYAACWLGRRLDVPELVSRGLESLRDTTPTPKWLSQTVRTLAWCRQAEENCDPSPHSRIDYFDGCEWWIARTEPTDPGGLVLAAKGGHNEESHNHNDCGTFIVHYGGESIVSDLGAAMYCDGYFGEDRYSSLATRSLGHSVPYVNGCEQASSQWKSSEEPVHERGAAEVLQRHVDTDSATFSLELAGCYPAAARLESLRRKFRVEWGSERLSVEDDFTFTDEAADNEYRSIIISYNSMTHTDGTITVSGDVNDIVITPDNANVAIDVERIEDGIHSKTDTEYHDVWRAMITPEATSHLRLVMRPARP